MTIEFQTCPRRMTEIGPWKYEENIDHWRADRWTDNHRKARLIRKRWLRRNPNGVCSDTMDEWIWGGAVPRTCSFCGGIHPEDALRLMADGWCAESTTKFYKRYLHPPGWAEAMRHNMRPDRRPADEGDLIEIPASPVPPIKLYVQHFSREQVERFNALILARAQS